MLARRPIAVRSPPARLDELIDWFDQFSSNLVLLEEYELVDVRRAVEAIDRAVRQHLQTFPDRRLRSPQAPESSRVALIRSDHVRFLTSLEQLHWFYDIVEREDHGGHRQALGQYGRVLTEALRRHRRDERSLLSPSEVRGPTALGEPAEQR